MSQEGIRGKVQSMPKMKLDENRKMQIWEVIAGELRQTGESSKSRKIYRGFKPILAGAAAVVIGGVVIIHSNILNKAVPNSSDVTYKTTGTITKDSSSNIDVANFPHHLVIPKNVLPGYELVLGNIAQNGRQVIFPTSQLVKTPANFQPSFMFFEVKANNFINGALVNGDGYTIYESKTIPALQNVRVPTKSDAHNKVSQVHRFGHSITTDVVPRTSNEKRFVMYFFTIGDTFFSVNALGTTQSQDWAVVDSLINNPRLLPMTYNNSPKRGLALYHVQGN